MFLTVSLKWHTIAMIVLSVFAVQTTKYYLGTYSHLSNNRGVWNKRGGVQKLQNQLAFFCQFLS